MDLQLWQNNITDDNPHTFSPVPLHSGGTFISEAHQGHLCWQRQEGRGTAEDRALHVPLAGLDILRSPPPLAVTTAPKIMAPTAS